MSIGNIFFIDIETVPVSEQCPDHLKELFAKRFDSDVRRFVKEESISEDPMLSEDDLHRYFRNKAGLYAEFGKVVAISIGKMQATKFYVKSLVSRDEKVLLQQFVDALEKGQAKILCAHNGKEFDFPFLMRRLIVNSLPVPESLNTIGKKPWDVNLQDTMQMWSGTQWNYKVSLDLLCKILGVESPKINMKGGSVSEMYYGMFEVEHDELPFDKEEALLKMIGKYCSGDVVALAQCYSRIIGVPLIEPDKIEYV